MMNENEDLISRLWGLGRRPVDSDVAARHLATLEGAAGVGASWPVRNRLKIVAAFAVGLMVGTSGLATAGALPNGAQEVAHRTLGAVGVKVPHGDRYQGPECGGEVKNHGQYVKSQPKEKRAEAAKSRCGKPVQAGTGDDSAEQPNGTGCQGPPPWAGKGKPDAAAKAARKQACGDGDDGDDKPETPAPAAGTQPAPLTQDPGPTTGPSTPTTDITATTETTARTGTTATTATTATTSPPPETTTPTTPADPPVPGLGS
jgi:hypothetical protein